MYFSHPNFPLRLHLEQVLEHCQQIVKEKRVNFTELNITTQDISDLLTLISLSHDAGKYSNYFQHYIRERGNIQDGFVLSKEEKRFLKKNPNLKNHSIFSAIVFLSLVNQLRSHWYQNPFLIYTGFYSILQHHSDLKNLNYILKWEKPVSNDIQLIEQSTDLSELCLLLKKHEFVIDPITLHSEVVNVISEFDNFTKNRNFIFTRFPFLFNYKVQGKEHFFFTYVFSTLIYSDKYAAIFKQTSETEDFLIPTDSVSSYKSLKGFKLDTPLNIEREELYQQVHQQSKDISLSNHLYTLTMNTGYGKTLTSFNFALQLRERLLREKDIKANIIYAMPFTSIIEQNFSVFEDVISTALSLNREKVSEDLLMKNHHLSQIRYQTKEEFEYDVDKSKYLLDTWKSEVVFTTFVQLLELLLEVKNKKLTKFPSLVNSIIVLDEIQSLNPELQDLFYYLFNQIGEIFNVYIVLCSATQSYIHYDSVSLVEHEEKYFQTERTQLVLPDNLLGESNYVSFSKTAENTLLDIEEVLDAEENKNALIILNTKKRALSFYEHFKNRYEDREVILLSNSLIPKHKKEIIENIKYKMKWKNVILISTQLIEAGVDLDFDLGFRDFCPLPSLIQSIGRVNRNFTYPDHYGKVYLLNVDNDSKKVYSKELLEYTHLSLKSLKKSILLEKDYYDLNSIYYQHIKDYFSKKESSLLLSTLLDMNYGELSFELIEEDHNMKTVFVEYDANATELWERYTQLPNSPLEAKREFYSFKADLLDYCLSLHKTTLTKVLGLYQSNYREKGNIVFIPNSLTIGEDNLYNKEKGIKLSDDINSFLI